MRPLLKGRGPHRVSGGEGILFCAELFVVAEIFTESLHRAYRNGHPPLDKGDNKKIPSFAKTKDGNNNFTRGTTFFGAQKRARLGII